MDKYHATTLSRAVTTRQDRQKSSAMPSLRRATVRRAGTDNVLQLSASNRRLSCLGACFRFRSRSELAKPFAGSETCPRDLEATTEQRQEGHLRRTGPQTNGLLRSRVRWSRAADDRPARPGGRSLRCAAFMRRTILKRTFQIFGVVALTILLSFGFVYHQATNYMVAQLDSLVTEEANFIVGEARQGRMAAFYERLRQDPRRVKPTGLFDAAGNRLAGNIGSFPRGLHVDSAPQDASVVRNSFSGREEESVRAIARRLPNGETLVVAWSTNYNEQTAEVVKRGLVFGLLPGFGLTLFAAVVLGTREQQRVSEMSTRVQRIVSGELQQRLPANGTDEPLDRLAALVNGMLDEIEMMVRGLASVGDDIAHDLRSPLTAIRIGLDRARAGAKSVADWRMAVDKAIARIDHAISIVTALLRIRDIERTRRTDGFSDIGLADLVDEIGELYEPFAEEKQLTFRVRKESELIVRGDRDLLFEAIANLVDNAIKYTPESGRVDLCLTSRGRDGFVRVADTGPGVREDERDLVVQRFYRSDRSRHIKGLGLGLSLVAAIVKLHGFRFNILPGPGFVAEIVIGATSISGAAGATRGTSIG
jgi:signal transduction histidine kinase